MSTSDLTSTSSSPRSLSKALYLSSSTTLLEDNFGHHEKSQTVPADNVARVKDKPDITVRAKVNTQLTHKQKPKDILRDRRVELDYQKVLRTMIIEPRKPPSCLDETTSFIRKTQKNEDTNLRSWERVLRSIGIRNFSHVNKAAIPIYNIKDEGVSRALEILMAEFGRGTHSSFLDDTYSIYLQEDGRAAICFKVIKKVAVIYGDPLCAANQVGQVFEAFCSFCRRRRWHVAVIGAGAALATYAKDQRWRTMEFGVEQVLNPMTNTVLNETSGKTITRTNRKLVNSGFKLHLYDPRHGIQHQLSAQLMDVYNAWRDDRRRRNAPQAYSAIIDPFSMPNVTRYLYTTDSDGKPNSLAGLIRLGATDGYLLEPCIQMPDAPKGITGFLVTHAMGLLRDEGITYMTFGLEALPELGEIALMPSLIENTSRHIYRTTFNSLGLLGRTTFRESFHPERDRQVRLYLLFPPGLPSIRIYQAVLHASHISPQQVWRGSRRARSIKRNESKSAKAKPPAATDRSAHKAEDHVPYKQS